MKNNRLDKAPAALSDAARGIRAWRTWAGVVAIGVLALLALIQGLSNEATAATLAFDVPLMPDNVASALSSEIAEALPFL